MNESTMKSLRVICLEDQPRDRELIAQTLAAGGMDCEIFPARNRDEFETALVQPNIDLILCDFTLPSYGGAEALETARKLLPDTPFIFVSGTIGEERAVEGLRSGATDYVLKDHLERLVPVVNRALREVDPGVRAILSTGYGSDGVAQQMIDEGMVGFVQKPFEAPRLSQAVAAAMAKERGT